MSANNDSPESESATAQTDLKGESVSTEGSASSEDATQDAAGTNSAVGTDSAPEGTHRTRLQVVHSGLRAASIVSLQSLVVAAGALVLFWVIGKLWVIVLPVVLAVIVCTVLWPPVSLMRKYKVPAALASLLAMVLAAGTFAGVVALIVPSVVDQAPELASRAVAGVQQMQDWVQGPPLNIQDEQLENIVSTVTDGISSSGNQIATGVFSGVGTATSLVVTLFATLVLVFFFLKDGPKFIPWLNRSVGRPGASHVGEVLVRMWQTLGGFIRTQAIVSAVDSVLIGAGLFILQVPLAGVLMILTFIGGFIPIVGAFVAGALAVLIALVSNGFTTALIVLAIILAVQQLEGNILQPWLQARTMDLHAVIVLLSVTLGGTVFGIIGAFLAVPAVATLAVVLRYLNEQIAQRAGESLPEQGEPIQANYGVPDDKPKSERVSVKIGQKIKEKVDKDD